MDYEGLLRDLSEIELRLLLRAELEVVDYPFYQLADEARSFRLDVYDHLRIGL